MEARQQAAQHPRSGSSTPSGHRCWCDWKRKWRSLERVDETYEIADVPALESVGRTEVWPRFTTFDGRWILDIEGREASPDEPLAPGESLVNLKGRFYPKERNSGCGC